MKDEAGASTSYVFVGGSAHPVSAYRGHLNIYADNELKLYTNASSTPKVVVDTSGNVGIGTTSPSRPLHVNDNDGIRVGTTASYQLDLKGAQTPAVTVGGSTLASVITTSGTGSASGHIGFEIPSNDANDGFYIATDADNDGTVDTLAMKINANGNVGIGTDSPSVALQVSGQIKNNNGYLIDNGTNAVS